MGDRQRSPAGLSKGLLLALSLLYLAAPLITAARDAPRLKSPTAGSRTGPRSPAREQNGKSTGRPETRPRSRTDSRKVMDGRLPGVKPPSGTAPKGKLLLNHRRAKATANHSHTLPLLEQKAGGGHALYPCSGDLPGQWDGEEWVIDKNQGCELTVLPLDWAAALSCLDGKRIAFVGDSHLRNAFRCMADQMTNGSSQEAVGCYGEGWNDTEEPEDWPKYSHMSLRSLSPSEGATLSVAPEATQRRCSRRVPAEAMHMHGLSCSNHFKVHRHDYSVELVGPQQEKVQLDFYWQPWGGDKPLIETEEVVEEMGWQAAKYRFNYTGGRSRSHFFASLKDSPRGAPDLVVSGGEARQHAALFQNFPGAAILVNHGGLQDQMDMLAARHGIPVADITSAINAQQPLFSAAPLERGNFGIPRVRHPPAGALRLQSNLVVTLAMGMLCPAAPGRYAHRRAADERELSERPQLM